MENKIENAMEILGVRIDNLSKKEILERVSVFLQGGRFCRIATVNPEFILAAQQDDEFRKILNGCDLNVPDGAGLKLAFWKKGERLKGRLAGADLVPEILKIAQARKLRLFAAVRQGGLSDWQVVKRALEAKFEGLEAYGADLAADTRIYTIDNADILLCNFGAPDQEKFIKSVKSDTIRLAIGVGGSFDFMTGKLKRAPVWMRNCGLEWLFRLVQQPRRFGRIWNAVVIFPIKVIFNR